MAHVSPPNVVEGSMKEALDKQNETTTANGVTSAGSATDPSGVIELTESEPLDVGQKVDTDGSVEAAVNHEINGGTAEAQPHVNGALQPNGTEQPELDVLVVGAGFSGVYALHRLRKAGFKVKLYEKAPDYGGTWYWNRYPGAAVDSEIPLYQFSQYETYCDWTWKERFPGHEEIRSYFGHLANVWDLRGDTVFNTAVTKMQVSGGHWVSETDKGETITSKFVVAATGSSHKQYLPAFPGIERFKGDIYHSSNWPHQGIDVTGKKIAIIGNGASGVQLLQELAKSECQLTAYIRSPAVNLPMNQRKPSAKEQAGNRSFYGALLDSCKKTGHGFPYQAVPGSFYTASEEERLRVFEELWARGGFAYFMANFPEWTYDTSINKIVYKFWRDKTERRIKNEQKRAIVCPVEQPYWLGTKRSNLEQDYYESLDRPNVELRSVQKSPFKEFTETSIVTEDGESRDYDIIILATGYDNITGSLFDLNATDKHGVSLREKWKYGVHTSYGLTVPGMPNFFMMYSPQSPSQLANGPPVIEIQGDWICAAMKKMQDEGIRTVEGNEDGAKKWRQDIQDIHNQSLFPQTESWYTGANIPGKVREQLVYLGGVAKYSEVIQDCLATWKGLDVVKPQGALLG